MIQDNKDQSTHYQIPIEITDREIDALQAMIDMYVYEEHKDCRMWRDLNSDEVGKIEPEDWEDGDHIWYDLRVIQGLLAKINDK